MMAGEREDPRHVWLRRILDLQLQREKELWEGIEPPTSEKAISYLKEVGLPVEKNPEANIRLAHSLIHIAAIDNDPEYQRLEAEAGKIRARISEA